MSFLVAESEEELKSLLMWVKEESEKASLKLNIQKTKIMASGPITSWQIDGEKGTQWQIFSWAPKSLWMGTVAHQALPSMGLFKQEYWSGLPFPSLGDLPDPGIEPRSSEFQADALTSEPPGISLQLFFHSVILYFWYVYIGSIK